MSAWGPGVFSDDAACDIRDDYRALIEDAVDDDTAEAQIIETWSDQLDADDVDTLWLALALTQSKIGRLSPAVRDKGLAAIDREHGVAQWAAVSTRHAAMRRAALEKARDVLTGPQPQPKRLRRPTRHVTDLQVGDILGDPSMTPAVVCAVVAMSDERDGVSPWIRRLAWDRDELPDLSELESMAGESAFPVFHPGSLPRLMWRTRAGGDWRDAGLVLLAKGLTAVADPRTYPSGSAGEWRDLRAWHPEVWE